MLADDNPEVKEYITRNPPIEINNPAAEVPITFMQYGKEYTGSLDYGKGAGAHVWHLMIDKYYWGRLRIAQGKWVFDATLKTESFSQLAHLFGEQIEALGK